jgi:MoaA/NifB/PqqE/SkfB family radical SAM enzyme
LFSTFFFSKNLKTIIADESFKFGISFTISIFNVLELEKIFDKFIELSMLKNFKFLNIQPVVEPSYFSILYLEDFQKVKIIDAINKILNKKTTLTETKNVKNNLIELRKMLDIPVDNFYQTVKERTTVLKTYDQLRGTNYKKLFPYIKDYE